MATLARSLQPAQLAKYGVELEDKQAASRGYIWLRCPQCDACWEPVLPVSGRLSAGLLEMPERVQR